MRLGWWTAAMRGRADLPAVTVAAAVLGMLVSAVLSQEQERVGAGEAKGSALVKEAYARTKTADTLEEYAEIIRLCEGAQASELSQDSADYVKQLLSWAQNRRGEAYAAQAAAWAKSGRKQEAADWDARALTDFEAAVESDPTRWKAIHNRGVSRALAGDHDEAIRDFSRVIELKPDYPNAWFNRGEIRYEHGEYEEAAADYNHALRLNDKDCGAYTSRGHAYFQLRRFRLALADYDQAVRLGGQTGDAYANRADAHQSLGQWGQAEADYRRAIELDDRLGRAYQGAAWLMATCPDAGFRKAEGAVEAAEKAIGLDGEDKPEYLDTLAAAYANAGRFAEAITALTKAIEAAPEPAAQRMRQRLALYEAEAPFRQQ